MESISNETLELVRLRYVRMINCQSWADGKMEFTDGLNTIWSEDNNTGKSVFMKVLKAVSCPTSTNRELREELIRNGKEYGEVHYGFSNGSAAIVRIYPQRILYRYTDNLKTGNWIQTEDNPPQDLVNNLNLIVDFDNKFVANLLDSEQDLLLVHSNPNLNYNLVRVLTEHETLGRLSNNFREKLPVFKSELQTVSTKADRLRHNRKGLEYVDVDRLIEDTANEEALVNSMLNMIDIFENSLDLEKDITLNSIDDLDELGDFCNLLNNIAIDEIALDELNLDDISLDTLNQDLEICETLMGYESSLSDFNSLINLEEDIKALEDLENIDLDCLAKFGTLLEELTIDDNLILDDDTDLDEVLVDVNNIETLNDILQGSSNLFNELRIYTNLENEIKELENINFDGEIYDCPIHGKIQYLGGECIIN